MPCSFLSFVPKIWSDETSEVHYYMLHIMLHVSVLLIGGVTIMAVSRFRSWKIRTPQDWANDAVWVVVVLCIFGQTFGYYSRDIDGFKHDIILKGVEMKNVGVVMITSHHTVLYSDKRDVIVVPSADVNQIIKKADSKQHAPLGFCMSIMPASEREQAWASRPSSCPPWRYACR